MHKLTVAAVAAALLAAPISAEAQMAEKDIVTVAVEAGSFTTLAAALEAAGLIETLQGEGPFRSRSSRPRTRRSPSCLPAPLRRSSRTRSSSRRFSPTMWSQVRSHPARW
jgi:hypothetical protein